MTHDHENNCPPKLQNTIWWVTPLLPALFFAWAINELSKPEPVGYINRLREGGYDV